MPMSTGKDWNIILQTNVNLQIKKYSQNLEPQCTQLYPHESIQVEALSNFINRFICNYFQHKM